MVECGPTKPQQYLCLVASLGWLMIKDNKDKGRPLGLMEIHPTYYIYWIKFNNLIF
jgi:hypothetical protein